MSPLHTLDLVLHVSVGHYLGGEVEPCHVNRSLRVSQSVVNIYLRHKHMTLLNEDELNQGWR